jgi:hypothetical protein
VRVSHHPKFIKIYRKTLRREISAGLFFLPKSVSSMISNIYYDFEPIIKPQFLSGNWGYFCFRREKDEQLSKHQPLTARVARKGGACQEASEARQHREPEASS